MANKISALTGQILGRAKTLFDNSNIINNGIGQTVNATNLKAFNNALRQTERYESQLKNALIPRGENLISAGLPAARSRTQAALNNIGNINARNAQVVSDISKYQNRIDGFGNLTPRGQILNLQSPAVERYPILQPGIAQQNGIIKPPSGTVRSVTNYGAIADQRQAAAAAAAERSAKRSEDAKRRAQAIESGNQLRSQYEAAVRDNYEKLWQNELGPQLDNARNIRNERISGVRDRQRAAVAAGQNARIDAHLDKEVAGWEQLGENSRNLNAVRGRQQAAYDAGQQVKANAAAERVARDKEYAKSILQDNVAEINERARRAQAIASGNELEAKYKQAVADNYDKFWQEQLNKQDYDAQLDASVSKERKLIQEEADNGFTIEGYNEGAKQYTAATQVDGKVYEQKQNELFAEQLKADEKRFKALQAAQNKVDAANAQKVVKQESTEPAQEAVAAQEAAAAPVGSGETLGSSARSMLTRDKDGKLIMDEEAYRALDTSDMKTWGAEKAQQYDIDSLQRMVEKEREAIDNAPKAVRDAKIQELEDKLRARAERGYGIGDWIFGNQLHTGAIGAAAIAGTMGVAFGGHKSNAELYASPF